MKCPVCEVVELLMSERQNIEIDYCPKCRGVWLDRGELDKFIQQTESRPIAYVDTHSREHSEQERSYQQKNAEYDGRQSRNIERPYRDDDEREDYQRYPHYGKKKESFLSKLFDFD
jgi:uncharacterized protein